ncbi:CocE/NonD family hydrolase [Chryseobacterium sp. MYb264]|uniref:CocE/NonD family hydrolase n=1 Tax=Chryseobacterium sp. MYb264 TaxID=2745153 RepID=UPI002E15AC4A|nr:CocE/NonD family hydrolase [Chryseobacterium sp. MYb264]
MKRKAYFSSRKTDTINPRSDEYRYRIDHEFKIYDSITIETKDHGILTLSVILDKKIPAPQSTILMNTIYADVNNINVGKEWAKRGYASVILNTRGKYLSPDTVQPFEHEEEDINEAIEWIIRQQWSDGKVGMMGGSYSAFSQWAAAKKLHASLKTIVPQAAVGIGTMDFPMRNHIFFAYTLQWLNQVMNNKMTDYRDFNDTRKWNSVYKNWYISGTSFRKLDSVSGKPNPVFQKWLNHPEEDEYWQKMIPSRTDFRTVDIPILSITGYFDANKLGALYYFNQHYQYHEDAEHYLVIGPYDHLGAQGIIKKEVRGYRIDPVAHVDINKLTVEWFDYILKGKPKPSFLKDKVNYQVMGTNVWKHIHTLDELGKNKLKLYLDPEHGSLTASASKNEHEEFSPFSVDYGNRSDVDELMGFKYLIVDDSLYRRDNLIFSTSPFEKAFDFSGNASLTLALSMNKKDADLYININELMPDGKYFQLSTNVWRASYKSGSEKRDFFTPDKKEMITVELNDFISKKIEKGSQLLVSIGAVKSPFWQINYGSGKPVNDESIEDAGEPLKIKVYTGSYLEIPYHLD